MTEENVHQLACDLCDSCQPIYQEVAYVDGHPYEHSCVGSIRRRRGTENPHDRHNRIRFCILDDQIDSYEDAKRARVKAFDWTPYEAHTAALMLLLGVGTHLRKRQPKDQGGMKGE